MGPEIPVATIVAIISTLGAPGVVLIMFYAHIQAMNKAMAEYRESTNTILSAYRKDIDTLARFYESNVDLVKRYDKLADDLSSVIHMNTQTMTHLVEKIQNNMYCPLVRQKGPHD